MKTEAKNPKVRRQNAYPAGILRAANPHGYWISRRCAGSAGYFLTSLKKRRIVSKTIYTRGEIKRVHPFACAPCEPAGFPYSMRVSSPQDSNFLPAGPLRTLLNCPLPLGLSVRGAA